jgi:SAM-dependent methyltransferase
MEFADHFSGHSPDYRRFRPGYPPELFAWLAEQAPGRALAWDAGTGSGQSAIGVAMHFETVIATDPSGAQLASAEAHPRVSYRVAAEQFAEFPAASVDLITVAQALHWFNFDRFFGEARRVLKPGGMIAAWAYNRSAIAPQIDPIVRRFQEETVGPYWPPERVHVEGGYRQLPFPFDELAAPSFAARHEWTARHFLEYLRTWSSVKARQREHGVDPVDLLEPEFLEAWGPAESTRLITFPLLLRAGRMR